VFDVLLRFAHEVVGHDLALVILDVPVATNSLHADANVHQLAMEAPVVALGLVPDLHRHQV
jgi:hypothetical protein